MYFRKSKKCNIRFVGGNHGFGFDPGYLFVCLFVCLTKLCWDMCVSHYLVSLRSNWTSLFMRVPCKQESCHAL